MSKRIQGKAGFIDIQDSEGRIQCYVSRATIRTIRQNLTWALFYNLVSIPVAALGVLHPSICATAMSASSIGVLMHSLRLKDTGKKERCFPWKKRF